MDNRITQPLTHAPQDVFTPSPTFPTRKVSVGKGGGNRRADFRCSEKSNVKKALQDRNVKINSKTIKGAHISTKRPITNNLNGTILFGQLPLVCRHISLMFATCTEVKKSQFTDTLGTELGLSAHVMMKDGIHSLEVEFTRVLQATPSASKHLIKGQDLGLYLSSLTRTMQPPSEQKQTSKVNCLLLTGRELHAMAMEVEKKSKDGVENIKVKFYDPNTTNTYKSAIANDFNDDHLKQLTVEKMLVEPDLAERYGPSVVVVCLDGEEDIKFDRQNAVENRSEEHLFTAMASGSTKDVFNMLKAESESSNPDKQLLRATNKFGFSGVYLACVSGLKDVIRIYAESLQDFGITDTEKILALMNPMHPIEDCSALEMLLDKEDSETIKFIAQVLKDIGLEDSDITKWLVNEKNDGTTSIHRAISDGHSELLKGVIDTLTPLFENKHDIFQLIKSVTTDGAQGLYYAFQSGHSEAIKVTVESLKQLGVENNYIAEWLTSTLGDEVSGSFVALQFGQSDTINVVVDLLDELGLENSHIVDWLAAKNVFGISSREHARLNGHADAINTITHKMNELGGTQYIIDDWINANEPINTIRNSR